MNRLMNMKLIDKGDSFYHSYYVHTWLRANSLAPFGCCAIAFNEHFILEMCTFNLQVSWQLPTYITHLIFPGQCKETNCSVTICNHFNTSNKYQWNGNPWFNFCYSRYKIWDYFNTQLKILLWDFNYIIIADKHVSFQTIVQGNLLKVIYSLVNWKYNVFQ